MKKVLALAGAMLLGASAAQAAIEYSFTNNADLSFTYLSDNFITGYADIYPGNAKLTQSTGTFLDLQFCPPNTPGSICKVSGGSEPYSQILFVILYQSVQGNQTMSLGRDADFDATAFTTLGTHQSLSSGMDGTLTVRDTTAKVPEPATWAMFIGGFGLVGALARRKRSAITAA